MAPAGGGGDRWVHREPLAGDASTRRYWRLADRRGQTAILVEYPPDLRAALARDLEVVRWLAGAGLRLPAVLEMNAQAGWALLEDLGPSDAEAALRAAPPGERPRLASALLAPLELLAARGTGRSTPAACAGSSLASSFTSFATARASRHRPHSTASSTSSPESSRATRSASATATTTSTTSTSSQPVRSPSSMPRMR
jgi:hypothetical protein